MKTKDVIIIKDIGKEYSRDGNKFWALKDISIDIEKGEIFGVIGKNGSGKSTLLKLCSRVMLPTEGRIDIYGKTGSLLEVGTGFHPELTGLENIYFNGGVLGIPKREITAKLDDIIKFSGVEKSINVPVKRYSSGMYTRLAFAVAAHLDVEIMFIDEVLAVGDIMFQRKCLDKMGSMADSDGRTILFVSHDMSTITRLCDRAIWLKDGIITDIGDSGDVVRSYIHSTPIANSRNVHEIIDSLPQDNNVVIKDISITQNGTAGGVFYRDYPIDISVTYSIRYAEPGIRIIVSLLEDDGKPVLRTYHDQNEKIAPILSPGIYTSTLTIPANLLSRRIYEVSIGAFIYGGRLCTSDVSREGIRIPISVEYITPVDCYEEDTYIFRPLVRPTLKWNTVKMEAFE